MKKFLVLLLVGLMVISSVFAEGQTESTKKVVDYDNMTKEELIKTAQEEGTLMIYTPSSRHSAVGQIFGEKYGIKVETTQLKDIEMIEKVTKEAAANLDAADVVYAQDGARVYPEMIMTGYVQSYTPNSLKEKFLDQYKNPQVWEMCAKNFIINNEWPQNFNNVWALTDPKYKGKVQFKNPFSESVNMNFLTMVTRDDWAKKLAVSYKNYYGKDLVLTTKNAGYEWIKLWFGNGLVLGTSDTTMSENIGAKGQKEQLIGLFTSNKLRHCEAKNLALEVCKDVEPFNGFIYPIYVFIPSNSKSPAAARLFIEYSLTIDGFAPFISIGDYSPNPDLENPDDSQTLEILSKTLIYEDPQWCSEHRAEVEEFISKLM
ncbi:MAG: ABC transporter substrate-binding protein [Sphaerochaetaceae bacterium]